MTWANLKLQVERTGILASATSLLLVFLISMLALAATPSFATEQNAEQKAVKRIECSLNMETPEEADQEIETALTNILIENKGKLTQDDAEAIVQTRITELKSEKSIYKRAWLILSRQKIEDRVIALCKGNCTYENVMSLTEQELDKLLSKRLNNFRSMQGYAVMAGLTAVSIWLSGKALAYIHVPEETRIIISGMVGGYIAMLRAPVDTEINRVGQEGVNKIWNYFKPKQATPAGQTKPNNGFLKTFKATQNMYTGPESTGRNDIICTVNDLIPRFLELSAYLGREATLTETEMELVARQFARNLYQMRVFHRGIAIDNVQFNELMTPTTRPFAKLYARVKPLVWAALNETELAEAGIDNKVDYDRPLINNYYKGLSAKWFEEVSPNLVPRTDLLTP